MATPDDLKDQYVQRYHLVLERLLQNVAQDDAENIVQDALSRCLEQLPHYQGLKDDLGDWFEEVVDEVYLDQVRQPQQDAQALALPTERLEERAQELPQEPFASLRRGRDQTRDFRLLRLQLNRLPIYLGDVKYN